MSAGPSKSFHDDDATNEDSSPKKKRRKVELHPKKRDKIQPSKDLDTSVKKRTVKPTKIKVRLKSAPKKQSCKFCSKFVLKLPRHLERKHSKEPDVAMFLALPIKSPRRRAIIDRIRNEGNYVYNREVLVEKNGNLIVKRRQLFPEYDKYVTCPRCFSMLKENYLHRHQRRCSVSREQAEDTIKNFSQEEKACDDEKDKKDPSEDESASAGKDNLDSEFQNNCDEATNGSEDDKHSSFKTIELCYEDDVNDRAEIDVEVNLNDVSVVKNEKNAVKSRVVLQEKQVFQKLTRKKKLLKPITADGESSSDSFSEEKLPSKAKLLKKRKTWGKGQHCKFCLSCVIKLPRHLEMKHADKAEVVTFLAFAKGSSERRELIDKIRNEGNYIHNQSVLAGNGGKLITKRQKVARETDTYVPCPNCFSMLLESYLPRHKKRCSMSQNLEKTSAEIEYSSVEVNRKEITSKKWHKRQYCKYCRKAVLKLPRHLQVKHSRELQVVMFMALPMNSLQRREIIDKIRNEGNHLHNQEVLAKQKGLLVTKRLRGFASNLGVDEDIKYVSCPTCFSTLKENYLPRHLKRRCPASKDGQEDAPTTKRSFDEKLKKPILRWKRRCKFCAKFVINLVRHLILKHATEPEVASIMALPKVSDERKKMVRKIRSDAIVLLCGEKTDEATSRLANVGQSGAKPTDESVSCSSGSRTDETEVGNSVRSCDEINRLAGEVREKTTEASVESTDPTFSCNICSEYVRNLPQHFELHHKDDAETAKRSVLPEASTGRQVIMDKIEEEATADRLSAMVARRGDLQAGDEQTVEQSVSSHGDSPLFEYDGVCSPFSDDLDNETDRSGEIVAHGGDLRANGERTIVQSVPTPVGSPFYEYDGVCSPFSDDLENEANTKTTRRRKRSAKKQSCKFCAKYVQKFPRHLTLHHRREPEVAAFMALPVKCKERRAIIDRLRNEGNFAHNQEKLAAGKKGELIIKRARSAPNGANESDDDTIEYAMCAYCRATLNRDYYMRHHRKRCPQRPVDGHSVAAPANETASLEPANLKRTCKFCMKCVKALGQHLESEHATEPEVAKLAALPKNSVRWRRLFVRIRKEGNAMRVGRSASERQTGEPARDADVSDKDDYKTCPTCFCIFKIGYFYKHKKLCSRSVVAATAAQTLTPVDPTSVKSKKWSKRQSCKFCLKCVQKLPRHLVVMHSNEPEVVRFLAWPAGSTQRRYFMDKIRNEGNYLHNREVLAENKGVFIPKRRTMHEGNGAESSEKYDSCPLCFGMLKLNYLPHHLRYTCSQRRPIVEEFPPDDDDPEPDPVSVPDPDPDLDPVSDPDADSVTDLDSDPDPVHDSDPIHDSDPLPLEPDPPVELTETKSKNMKKWDKKHNCKFCLKLVLKLPRHLELKHSSELEVKVLLSFPKGSYERRVCLEKIRNEGNFVHNQLVMSEKTGIFITKRRKTVTQNDGSADTGDKYVPCPTCLCMLKEKCVNRHKKYFCLLRQHANKRRSDVVERRTNAAADGVTPAGDQIEEIITTHHVPENYESNLLSSMVADAVFYNLHNL